MSKEEMREGFEAWHCEQYKTHGMTGAPTRDMHGGVYDENYGPPKQQALWECWQETGGDVATVEALKDEIERIELGKKAVAFLMLGDIFYGTDGPEVDDWDIQYDHKVCEVLAQSNPGAQIPLFTRSDAGEVDRLSTVVEQLKREAKNDAIAYRAAIEKQDELRAELGECKGEYDRAVNKVDALRDQLDEALKLAALVSDASPGMQRKSLSDLLTYLLLASTGTEPANKEGAQ